MEHLKTWLSVHPIYSELEIRKRWNSINSSTETSILVKSEILLSLCQEALLLNKSDEELWLAMGVIYFIPRELQRAAQCFKEGLKYNPGNHSLWNKLGAALANSGLPSESIIAYNQALALQPNYPRAYINKAIAYSNNGQYKLAIQNYLTALSLNPRVLHVWQYLRNCFDLIDRMDLVDATMSQNLQSFSEYDFLTLQTLPMPDPQLICTLYIYIYI